MSNAGERFKEILAKLEAEEKRKKDVVAPINSIRVNPDFTFEGADFGKAKFTDHAFGQLCNTVYKYPLPPEYFKNLFEDDPEWFAVQMNRHLEKGKGLDRKFRTIGNIGEGNHDSLVRGVVSKNFIPYDNLDTLSVFEDVARSGKIPEFDLKIGDINDNRMFLRFMFPDTERNFGRSYDGQDDRNFVALDLINSEVGLTSIMANPSIYRLICTNGMVAKEAEYGWYKQRHIHIDPLQVNMDLKKSIVHGIEMGRDILGKFEQARQITVQNPYEEITRYGKKSRLSDKMLKAIRENYDIEADKSLFGVVNAFTRTARDLKSVQARIDLEKFASKVLDEGLKAKAS
jgi:hypothetical protein